jgi:hypothetical protein
MAVRVARALAVALVLVGVAVGAAAQEAFFEFNVKPDGQRTVMRRELVRFPATHAPTHARTHCHR